MQSLKNNYSTHVLKISISIYNCSKKLTKENISILIIKFPFHLHYLIAINIALGC